MAAAISTETHAVCYAVELHCHLDGCVTPSIVYNAAKRNNMELPANCNSEQDLLPYMVCMKKKKSLKDMLDKFYFYFPFIAGDAIAIKELCLYFARQQYENRVYYTEVRFCPHSLSGPNLNPEQVLVLILDTLRKASAEYGIIIKSILSHMRFWKADKRAYEIVAFAVKYGQHNGGDVVGIDLAGNERASDSKDGWNELFKKAKYEHNLNITIHAGEACGPESVWDALDNMYADRIGHGYACVKDERLMERVKKEQIHLECCPTSSVITNAVENHDKHPIAVFKDLAINVGINTDDPVVLNCQYQGEMEIARKTYGFTQWDIVLCWIRAAAAAFLQEQDKYNLVQEVITRIQLYYLRPQSKL